MEVFLGKGSDEYGHRREFRVLVPRRGVTRDDFDAEIGLNDQGAIALVNRGLRPKCQMYNDACAN